MIDNEPVKGQTRKEYRFAENSKFIIFFKNYVEENKVSNHVRGVPALKINYIDAVSFSVDLSTVALLSEIKADMPNDLAFINGRIVMIYNSRLTYDTTEYWFNRVKNLTVADICDNLELHNVKDGPVGKCSFKFDPDIWRITFRKKRMIEKRKIFN